MTEKVQPSAVGEGRKLHMAGCSKHPTDQSGFSLGNGYLSFKGNTNDLLISPF